MENNENNIQNQDVENIQSNVNGSKKLTIVLLIIVLILLLATGIGGGFLLTNKLLSDKNNEKSNTTNSANVDNTKSISEQEMYEDIIKEYKDAQSEFDLENEDSIISKYKMVNSTILYMVTRYKEYNQEIAYTYYDIDKNGIKELIVGVGDKQNNGFSVGAVYSYNPNSKKVEKLYFQDTMERGNLNIYDNGILFSAGSGGAALHIAEFGKIGANGYSYEQLEWVEEEYKDENTKPVYTDLNTNKVLDYKSWEEMADKYLKNANKVSFENIEIIELENKSGPDEQKNESNTEAQTTKKEIIASGWAGSSMHRVRLYSNGDAYYITFNGNGETEDCIIGKDLVAKNVEDIIEKKGEHGEFAGVIVKGKNMTVVNRNATDWIFFETANENTNTATTNTDSEYDTAIAEIKKCLKDKNWLKENVYIKPDQQIVEGDLSDQKVNFIICRGNRIPVIVIEVSSENVRYSKVVLVAYVNGSVKSEIIDQGHIYHCGYSADANKNVVATGFMHMGDNTTTLHKIENGNIKKLGMYGTNEAYENGKENIKYFIADETMLNKGEHKYVGQEEYEKFKAGLKESQYKYVSIGTELTDANVEAYVK